MSLRYSSLEVLEARIAPANVLLSSPVEGASSAIYAKGTKAGVIAEVNSLAQADGASLGILIEKGDSLYLHSGAGSTYNPGTDILLAKATAGRALLLFTDLNHDGRLTGDEVTGIEVSDGFGGTVLTTVHGSVVSDLAAKGKITKKAGTADLEKVTFSSGIDGSLLVSGSLKQVEIGAPSGTASVQDVKTGSAAGGSSYSLNGGSKILSFTSSETAAGNISALKLTNGAATITSGSGGDITNVQIGKQVGSLSIQAGSATASGAGGSISSVVIKSAAEDTLLDFLAGDGAEGVKTKAGGKGGSISGVRVESAVNAVTFTAGIGGSSESGAGGDGGSLGGTGQNSLYIAELSSLDATAGDGGSGVSAGTGGNITGLTVVYAQDDSSFNLTAGSSGSGLLKQANGGSIAGFKVQGGGAIDSVNLAAGGVGGSSEDEKSDGGNGGSISDTSLSALSMNSLSLVSGDAGAGGTQYKKNGDAMKGGSGGRGGSISFVTLSTSDPESFTSVSLTAGTGGDGAYNQPGGAGGSIAGLSLAQVGDTEVKAGDGGGSTDRGDGGAGGSISGISKLVASGDVSLLAGNGGDGLDGADGGAGGSIGGVGTESLTSLSGSLTAKAGQGGGGSAHYNDDYEITKSGAAGVGGKIQGLSILASVDDLSSITLTGGAGGAGSGSGAGGAGGSVSSVTLSAFNGLVGLDIVGGDGGETEDDSAAPGVGGAILNIAITGDPLIATIAGIVSGQSGDGLGYGDISSVTLNGSSLLASVDNT